VYDPSDCLYFLCSLSFCLWPAASDAETVAVAGPTIVIEPTAIKATEGMPRSSALLRRVPPCPNQLVQDGRGNTRRHGGNLHGRQRLALRMLPLLRPS